MDNENCGFVLVDRSILTKLGYQNTFKHLKDREGNLKRDTNGKPKFIDNRNEFTHFTLFLKRHPEQFIEGTSFEDTHANYIIKKCTSQNAGAVRKDIHTRFSFLRNKLISGLLLHSRRRQLQIS